MARLSIREASKKFGLSRARLYQLLSDGKIEGEHATRCGRAARSWIEESSLAYHIQTRKERKGKVIKGDDKYVSVRDAAKESGYSRKHIYHLARKGSIGVKLKESGLLICLNDLKKMRKWQRSL
ncbi:MAG: hypothetical protein ABFS56_23905 [Pseudomonadota bacterium]